MATNTTRARYFAWKAWWLGMGELFGTDPDDESLMPSAALAPIWLMWGGLKEKPLKAETMKTYLMHLAAVCGAAGRPLDWLADRETWAAYKTVKRREPKAGPKTPFTWDMFQEGIRKHYSPREDPSFWVSTALGIKAMLRASELTGNSGYAPLSWNQLTFQREAHPATRLIMNITLPKSKTDIFRDGCVVTISEESPPRGTSSLVAFPVHFLYEKKTRTPMICTGAVFKTNSGKALTRVQLSNFLGDTARRVHLSLGWTSPVNATTHSLRRGGATSLHNAHVPLKTIMDLGRWKSNAVEKYLKTTMDARCAAYRTFDAGSARGTPRLTQSPFVPPFNEEEVLRTIPRHVQSRTMNRNHNIEASR